MVILDTNVISEAVRPLPDPAVMRWLRGQRRSDVWTNSVVVAELLSGVELMPPGKRREQLRGRIEEMMARLFSGRVLPFDLAAAQQYGLILARRQKIGRPIDPLDAQIAAITAANQATVATRNTADFQDCNISMVNPWRAEEQR